MTPRWERDCPDCGRRAEPLGPAMKALAHQGYAQVLEHRTGCAVYRSRDYDRRRHAELGIAHVVELGGGR